MDGVQQTEIKRQEEIWIGIGQQLAKLTISELSSEVDMGWIHPRVGLE